MSEPSSIGVNPIDSAAAEPPDDPPAVRVRSCGLLVVPYTWLKLWISPAKIGRLVLANGIAPAARSRATGAASSAGRYVASCGAPDVVMQPSVWNESLIVIGTPCSGPSLSPLCTASSAARAAARARSRSHITTALIGPSSCSIRDTKCSSASRADTSRPRIAAARSPAVHQCRSDVTTPCVSLARGSIPLPAMGLLGWILVGLIAGLLARWIVKDSRTGCIYTVVVGVLGALIGGGLMSLIDEQGVTEFSLRSIVVAALGAVLLLLMLQAIAGRRRH